MSRAQPAPSAPAPTTATDVTVGSSRPKRQALDLPSLDDSDTRIAELVSALSHHPTLARLLATKGLVRATTLAVAQIGEGRTPADPLQAIRPAARLRILGTDAGRLDPASYARWDPAVAALTSIDPADAAQLYVNVKPLFDQAYIELGHPGGDFDTAIVDAIEMLEDTPDAAANPMLERRATYFEHQDAALGALPPVQKQFLLIGRANRQKTIAWMNRFADALELELN